MKFSGSAHKVCVKGSDGMSNRVNPDQTAPVGAV